MITTNVRRIAASKLCRLALPILALAAGVVVSSVSTADAAACRRGRNCPRPRMTAKARLRRMLPNRCGARVRSNCRMVNRLGRTTGYRIRVGRRVLTFSGRQAGAAYRALLGRRGLTRNFRRPSVAQLQARARTAQIQAELRQNPIGSAIRGNGRDQAANARFNLLTRLRLRLDRQLTHSWNSFSRYAGNANNRQFRALLEPLPRRATRRDFATRLESFRTFLRDWTARS